MSILLSLLSSCWILQLNQQGIARPLCMVAAEVSPCVFSHRTRHPCTLPGHYALRADELRALPTARTANSTCAALHGFK